MRLLLLGLLTFTFSNHSFAQKGYINGFIVTHDKDTVIGEIRQADWKLNPKRIWFRSSEGEQQLGPFAIAAFGFDNDLYVSAVVDINISSTKTHSLSETPEPEIVKDTTFLRVLVEGPKYLYHHKDVPSRDHFYVQMDNQPSLLIYKKYLTTKYAYQYIAENKFFLGQLAIYLTDCPVGFDRFFASTSYAERSLVRLFRRYYECTGDQHRIRN